VTRQEIEQKMDELAREYRDTHDREIIEELYRLDRERTDRFFSCVFFGIVLAKN
jgi:FKBP-type peptidyl-prolyl cis-trans isomerase (trigger factor)